VILDEIYESIKRVRVSGNECPFLSVSSRYRCHRCKLLFPEIIKDRFRHGCPCIVLGRLFVKSEMRRLFP